MIVFANSNLFDGATANECLVVDAAYRAGDMDVRQAETAEERIFPNSFQPFLNGNLLKVFTLEERLFAQLFDSTEKADGSQAGALGEDFATKRDRFLWNGYCCQTCTKAEGIVSYLGKRLWQSDSGQARTIVEGRPSNLLHALGNSH